MQQTKRHRTHRFIWFPLETSMHNTPAKHIAICAIREISTVLLERERVCGVHHWCAHCGCGESVDAYKIHVATNRAKTHGRDVRLSRVCCYVMWLYMLSRGLRSCVCTIAKVHVPRFLPRLYVREFKRSSYTTSRLLRAVECVLVVCFLAPSSINMLPYHKPHMWWLYGPGPVARISVYICIVSSCAVSEIWVSVLVRVYVIFFPGRLAPVHHGWRRSIDLQLFNELN